jgi:ankyrin repeat protein
MSDSVDIIPDLLAKGASAWMLDIERRSAVAHARSAEAARLLLDAYSYCSRVALIEACQENRPEVVRVMLEKSEVDVDANEDSESESDSDNDDDDDDDDEDGDEDEDEKDTYVSPKIHWTPMMDAARRGYLDVMRVLLDCKADLSKRGPGGTTALHEAAAVSQAEAVKLLLDSGADPLAEDDDGNTALVRAHKAEMVKLLLAAAPSALNHRNAKSREPLAFMAVNAGDTGALEEVFKYTDSDGVPVNVNHKDINGDAALHMAVMVGNVAGVKLLLAKGADASAVGLDGMTVFMRAVDLKQYWQYNIEFHYFHVQATMDKGFHASRTECLKAVCESILSPPVVEMEQE